MKLKLLLAMSSILVTCLFGCGGKSDPTGESFTVQFHTCTDLETNVISNQYLKQGELVDEPIIITPKDSSTNVKANGWYTSEDYKTKWNFDTDRVSGNLDLYAKWAQIHSIYYYLEGKTTPIWTVTDACVGDPLERHDELCDGYLFEGYFEDPSCTIPFDLEKPLNEDTTVYMKRNNIVNLNPDAIKRRFVTVAASGTGSKAGTIGEPGVDVNDNRYVDVNFGYSTSRDPYIQISNPVLDISESQKLKLTFKNLGGATSFSFYWVTKYENDTYAGGTTYYTPANSIVVNLSESERNMNKDDNNWVVKEVDMSSIVKDGVSTWGNSVSLIKLRLQFGYACKSETDLTNIIRFKSIEGISDPEHKGFKDSQEIKNLCVNDSQKDIEAAAAKQTNIEHGLIFPKNNSAIVSDQSKTIYSKTNGALLYAQYGKSNNKYVFNPIDTITAEDCSYLRINLSNYSYVSTLDISITTLDEGIKRITGGTFNISPKQTKASDYFLNLFEMENFHGTVQSITLKFDFKGVDNAILIKEIEFQKSKSFQVPGINFNDNSFGGFIPTANISLARNESLAGTTFTCSSAGSVESTLSNAFDTTLYASMKLVIYYPSNINGQNMHNVTVSTMIDGTYYDYEFEDIETSSKMQTLTVPYDYQGSVQAFKITVDGGCLFTIQKITFEMEEEGSIDFSNYNTINNMLSDWKEGFIYDNSLSAGYYSSSSNTSRIRYYFGDRYAGNFRKTGNVSLEGKTKVYFLYQKLDCGANDKLYVYLHGLKKTSTASYKTAVGSEQLLSKQLELVNAPSNTSWVLGCVTIDSKYTQEDLWYCSQVSFSFVGTATQSPSIAIRAIAIR